jgi:hypothetical protein
MVVFNYRMAVILSLIIISGVLLATADPMPTREPGTTALAGNYPQAGDTQTSQAGGGVLVLCPYTAQSVAGSRANVDGNAIITGNTTVLMNWSPADPLEHNYHATSLITGNDGLRMPGGDKILNNLSSGKTATMSFEVPGDRSTQISINVSYDNGAPAANISRTFWTAYPAAGETGTIRYIDLESGFFGIIGDDARSWYPLNLPERFAKDGLRVRYIVRSVKGISTITMWGEPARVIDMELAGPVQSLKLDSTLAQFIDPGLLPVGRTSGDLTVKLMRQGLILPGGAIPNATDPSFQVHVQVITSPSSPVGTAGKYMDKIIASDTAQGIIEGWLPLSRLSAVVQDQNITFVRIAVQPSFTILDRCSLQVNKNLGLAQNKTS